jgi:hypothetical protein
MGIQNRLEGGVLACDVIELGATQIVKLFLREFG